MTLLHLAAWRGKRSIGPSLSRVATSHWALCSMLYRRYSHLAGFSQMPLTLVLAFPSSRRGNGHYSILLKVTPLLISGSET